MSGGRLADEGGEVGVSATGVEVAAGTGDGAAEMGDCGGAVAAEKAERTVSRSRSQPADPMNTMLNELSKSMGREMGKSIQRGLFGSLFGRK